MNVLQKITSITEFNLYLDKEYEDLNKKSESWYPIMYYNENINVASKNYMTIGINPSLTDEAKLIINDILEIEQFNVEVDGKGVDRHNKFNNKRKNIITKLIAYQNKLKFSLGSQKFQIQYFKTLHQFFKSIGKNFESDVFHYDFCQLRNTDSGDIKQWLKQKDNYNLLCKHFDMISKFINPEYIFIFNATLLEILMENDFFDRKKNNTKSKKHFDFYNDFMDDDGICHRRTLKFIIANQLSGGATSRVYRANLVANVKRLLSL